MWKRAVLSILSYRAAEKIKTALALLLYYTGIALLFSRVRAPGAAILVYHSIGGDNVFKDNVVSVSRFAEQVAYLARQRRVVPMHAIVQQLERGGRIPSSWVAITFDDGYRDNLDQALPVLAGRAAAASFYITWQVVEGEERFFYDDIEAIVNQCAHEHLTVSMAGTQRRFSLVTVEHRSEAVMRMVLSIRDHPHEERRRFVNDLLHACGTTAGSNGGQVYLKADEIRKLARAGMEVGSHTLTHPNLASLEDGKVTEELERSKTFLEACIDQPVLGLAYPFGKARHYTQRVQEAARAAGYRYALTTNGGTVRSDADPFALPRIGVRDTHLARLKVNLMGIRI